MHLHPDPKTGKHSLERATRVYFALRLNDGLAQSSLVRLEYELRLGVRGILLPLAEWMQDWTPALAQRGVEICHQRRGPASAKAMVTTARGLWRRLQREGLYDMESPWSHIKRPTTVDRAYPVEADDARTIDQECMRVMDGRSSLIGLVPAAAIRVLFRTGLRSSEALNMVWGNVNFAAGTITIPDHKTSKRHGPKTVTAEAAMPILAEIHERGLHPDYVFPGKSGKKPFVGLHRPWKKLCTLVGRSEYRIHDIRHCFGVQMIVAGAGLRDVQKAYGHASIKSTERYTKMAVSKTTREGVNKAMKRMFGE